ncbi:hypothetical protein [Ferruginibacter sp.]|nr:hypothetical protein [Ferruginibacter sp.]
MELDDLKNTWNNMSNEVQQQPHLNTEKINQMTSSKYHSRIKKIAYPEMAGIFICITGVAFTLFNFSKLNTVFFQATAVVAIAVLLLLSAISWISIRRLNVTGDVNKPYAATLKNFAVQKIRFHKLQKINVTLSYLLLVCIIILLPKFFTGKDITSNNSFWIFAFSIGYIFLLFYSKWVAKYYSKSLRQAENLLKELATE